MGVAAAVAFLALLVGSLAALVRVKGPPLSHLAFAIGMATGELAGHLLVVTAALAVGLEWWGWPHGGFGTVVVVLAAADAAAYAALLVVGLRARLVVTRSLAAARWPKGGTRRERRPGWLRWWRTWLALPVVPGARVHRDRDIPYVGDDPSDDEHLLDVIRPSGDVAGAPVLLYVHGGAWVMGSKREQGLPMLYELAARGWVCVSCNYRLSPGATWPDHIVDVKHAIAWTRSNVARFGGDAARFLAVAGGSAGGQLAALAALSVNDAAFQPGFEHEDTTVDACVSLYGVMEMTGDPRYMGRHGAGLASLLARDVMKVRARDAPDLYASASPIERITSTSPAFLVLQGGSDSIVPVEVARAFVQRFERTSSAPLAYVELPLAQHAFELLCSPRTSAVTRGIADALDALVYQRASSTP